MEESLAARLLGSWELVEVTATLPNGETVQPWGPRVRGRATFSPDGVFAAQIGRMDRARFASDERGQSTAAETHEAFRGYLAYYGRYTVDEAAASFTTTVEASLFPNWEGSRQTRRVTLEGHDALFTTPPRRLPQGIAVQTLRWRRVTP